MSEDLTPKQFLGLSGFFRQWGNFGIAGVICGLAVWLVTVELPRERERSREDMDKARSHGDAAAKVLGEAIREQTAEIKDHNAKVRSNQEKMIEAMQKK